MHNRNIEGGKSLKQEEQKCSRDRNEIINNSNQLSKNETSTLQMILVVVKSKEFSHFLLSLSSKIIDQSSHKLN
ncbi:CLUMA_CG007331, isoform A [Clunio marinus]|uniref:CLUMA_CG007331, isoform A n=1 Tax=Clunio marinus TaxID=568069 RepID=A0A1J1I2I1_9DIPT|nr:CLUMA_CG007331, isoform A [Clunio marinus]